MLGLAPFHPVDPSHPKPPTPVVVGVFPSVVSWCTEQGGELVDSSASSCTVLFSGVTFIVNFDDGLLVSAVEPRAMG